MFWAIIGQILGIVATLLTILSYQMNSKRSLLLVQSVATMCTCLGYLCLGATSGFILNILCLIRNVCFYFQKERTRGSYISAGLFATAICILGALSWQGPISFFIIIALAVNTVYMSLGDPQLLRKSILVTSPMVIVYNVVVFTIGGILNEALAIISSVVGILRFYRNKNT